MKINYHSILCKQVTLNVSNAAQYLFSAICESTQCSEADYRSDKNIFGRPVTYSSSGDISFSIGFASTGLRAGIILNSKEITSNLENIYSAVRLHIPLVIYASVESQFQVHQLSQSGAIVFLAGTSQEALDLLLLAYRIAEFSLIPVVICLEERKNTKEENILFPGKELLAYMAENADHLMACPTASQQIIFGKNRKRIPNWFNVDNPVSIGAIKNQKEGALETAAQQEYFYGHLDEIINDSFVEFDKFTGRKYNDIDLYSSKDADYLVMSMGSISQNVVEAIDELRLKNKFKIASARLVRINPFPVKSATVILAVKKGVTVLEQEITGISHSILLKEVSSLSEAKQLKLFSGNYGSLPSVNSLIDVIMNMMPNEKGKSKFWIDIDFTHSVSIYPKHQVLLQTIEREYPDAQNKSISSHVITKSHQIANANIPLSIRKYKDLGPNYTRLSRFYDNTANFYLTDSKELVADPFQAIPLMPPSTAGFNLASHETERKLLPVFHSNNCTGCGDCSLHCPHSAINPLVIGIENLIKAGIAISNASGVKITHLIPLVKNIAKNCHEVLKFNKERIHSVSDFMLESFTNVSEQMKLEGEKLLSAKQDIEAVVNVLKELPVSITDIFYNNPNIIKNGSGDLFSLAIDMNSCTGCSICSSVCAEDAIKMSEESNDVIAEWQTIYSLWEQIPDTQADIIMRLLDEKNFNPFSAILLSRHFNQALNGTSCDMDGMVSKSIVHLLAAIAEATIQPRIKEAMRTIDELINGLSLNIHTQLGSALPFENFEALSKVLSEMKEDRNPFEEIIGKLGTGDQLKIIDTKSLKRKVDLAKSLRTFKWLLNEGSTGTGRARMGFATDGDFAWSNSYPWNNFISPVLIHISGATPNLAGGIVQGHIRQLLDNIKVLRRAEMEIQGSYEPDINDVQIASLTWNDLTEKEKNLVQPIIIIGNKERLAGKDLNALIRMLDNQWPLKAIILDDAAPGTESYHASIAGDIGALLPVLALQKVQVIKSSLAAPAHLFSGLSEAINSSIPALAWIFTPSVSKHLIPFETFSKLPALSLNSRAFSLFSFKPGKDINLLSSKIEIGENPNSSSVWIQNELSYKENNEDKKTAYALTWADWAFTLKAWRDNFFPYTDAMGKAILVSEFILLSKSERVGKTPVIFRIDHNGELKKYRISDAVVLATEACANAWQLLREISGELTEFPEKLQKKITSELSIAYEKKMVESIQEYESKIANFESEHLEKIRIRLKEKLVMLSEQANEKLN